MTVGDSYLKRTGAHFTMLLQDVIEEYPSRDDFIKDFLSDYPIFDEEHRPVLNNKIIDHYLLREIGRETVPMFKLSLKRKLNEIMPPYNKLYISERDSVYNPLVTTDLRTTGVHKSLQNMEGSSETNATNESDTENKSAQRTKDFPQLSLDATKDYASSGVESSSSSTGKVDNKADSSDKSKTDTDASDDVHITGRSGDAGSQILSYRATILNIDLSIIEDLSDCFMLVASNGDSFTSNIWRGYNAYDGLYGPYLWP